MTDLDVHGPIDFVLLEAPGSDLQGEMAAELLALVEQGTIRVFDVVVVRKEADGTFSGIVLDDLDADGLGGFAVFAGARSGLLSDEDLAQAADAMEPDTVAALIVYENTWAIPFVAAAQRAGAQLIASDRIPAQVIVDAFDALETDG